MICCREVTIDLRKHLLRIAMCIIVIFVLMSCSDPNPSIISEKDLEVTPKTQSHEMLHLSDNVILANYFTWIDSILVLINTDTALVIDEYSLIHANPWIADSLVTTDYYLLSEKGIIVKDLLSLEVIPAGSEIHIPDRQEVEAIQQKLSNIRIDLNIPEYKLRIYEGEQILYEFLVRVGRNERKFLAMAQHYVNLRTKTGVGEIVRVVKNASFINPVDNRRYYSTRRDDEVRTTLPNIPWLEPELDGVRHGQLIHPTTNLRTLGKAYSNGCVGLRESDAWILYYHAPLGTAVEFRYDLEIPDGTQERYIDIYKKQ